MSGVFRNIDPPTPSPPGECAFGAGEDTLAKLRGGGGSIVRKTPDTALYSIYASTSWGEHRSIMWGGGGGQTLGGAEEKLKYCDGQK